jgi:hypothetical protein
MEAQLSWGAVTAIWEDPAAVSVAGLPVVLQVMNLRPWPDAPGSGWRAMLLSDGHHFISAALPPYVAASPAALGMREGAVVHFPNFELRVEVRKRCASLPPCSGRLVLWEQFDGEYPWRDRSRMVKILLTNREVVPGDFLEFWLLCS